MVSDTRKFLEGIMDGKNPVKRHNNKTGKYEDKYIRYNDNTEEFEDLSGFGQSMMPKAQDNTWRQSMMPKVAKSDEDGLQAISLGDRGFSNSFDDIRPQKGIGEKASEFMIDNADNLNSGLNIIGGAMANFSQGYTYGLDNVFAGVVNAIGAAPIDHFVGGKPYKEAFVDRYNEVVDTTNKMQYDFEEENPETAKFLQSGGVSASPIKFKKIIKLIRKI